MKHGDTEGTERIFLGEQMISFLKNRVALVGLTIALFLAGALTATRAEDKPAKVPTTHYVDRDKHFAIDVPLSWERKWPENNEAIRFLFMTGGKSGANAQPPDFTIVTAGPDAKDESLKTLAAYVAAFRKQAAAGAENVKLDKDMEVKLGDEPAISFTGTGTTKAGPAKFVCMVALHEGMGFAASFACDPATFDAEYAAAKPVIESIKWGK